MWLMALWELIRTIGKVMAGFFVLYGVAAMSMLTWIGCQGTLRISLMPVEERFQINIQRQSVTEGDAAAIQTAEAYLPPISPSEGCVDCGPCKSVAALIQGYEQQVADARANPEPGTTFDIEYTATIEHRDSFIVPPCPEGTPPAECPHGTTYEDVDIVQMEFSAGYYCGPLCGHVERLIRTVVFDSNGNIVGSDGECEPYTTLVS